MKVSISILMILLLIGVSVVSAQEPTLGVHGILTDGASQSAEITDTHTMHLYAFRGAAGDAVTLEMTARDGDVDPFLILITSDGDVVAWDDDSGDSLNAIVTASLPTDGIYWVLAGSLRTLYSQADDDIATGRYDISLAGASGTIEEPLRAADFGLPALEIAAPINGTLSEDAPLFLGALDVQDSITIDLTTQSADADTLLYVFDAEGRRIAVDDDGGEGTNAAIPALPLTVQGQYVIVVSTFDFYKDTTQSDLGNSGFTLQLSRTQ